MGDISGGAGRRKRDRNRKRERERLIERHLNLQTERKWS